LPFDPFEFFVVSVAGTFRAGSSVEFTGASAFRFFADRGVGIGLVLSLTCRWTKERKYGLA
jgi:hypothetical protein